MVPMLVVLGLIVFLVAAVVGVTGVVQNTDVGQGSDAFTLFGVEFDGSTGTLFLIGIVVGAAAALGLGMMVAGARRSAVRGRRARHDLADSRRETAAVSRQRDDLADRNLADRNLTDRDTRAQT